MEIKNSILSLSALKNVQIYRHFLSSLQYTLNNFAYPLQDLSLSSLCDCIMNNQDTQESSEPYFLGGQRIMTIAQCLEVQKKQIFLTYRKNIHLQNSVDSDFGWGCLLRVGQMALAQAIKLYFLNNQSKTGDIEIIGSFLDVNAKKFSYNVKNLVREGKNLWNKSIGEWYSIMETVTVLQEVHSKHPMQGAKNLKLQIVNQTIDIQQLEQFLDLQQYQFHHQYSDGKIFHQQVFSKQIQRQEINLEKAICRKNYKKTQQKNIMLIVTTKLGQKAIEQKQYDKLLKLMELPIFMGCIGGVPGKARFLSGKHGSKISYLDPHLVQQSIDEKSLNENLESFICKEYRLMSRDKLHPEMAICFFIKNKQDINLLNEAIDQIRKNLNEGPQKIDFINYVNREKSIDLDKSFDLSTVLTLDRSDSQIEILQQQHQMEVASKGQVLVQ